MPKALIVYPGNRGPPSLISLMVSVDIKHHVYLLTGVLIVFVFALFSKNLSRFGLAVRR